MNPDWIPPGDFYEGTHFVVKGLPLQVHGVENNPVPRELIVCLHGIKSYYVCWNRFADYVVTSQPDKYVVIMFDQMGRGFSDPSRNGHYTEREYLPAMFNLLTYLKRTYLPLKGISVNAAQKFHVVGHSFGGCLSALFACKHPDFVKSLTLLAPAGLLNFVPLGLIQRGPILRMLTKAKVEKRENQIVSWRDDFYFHEGESLLVENEQRQQLSKMYDLNPNAFPSFWSTLTTFPMIDISKPLHEIKNNEKFPVFLLWADRDDAISFKSSYPRWLKIFEAPDTKCSFEKKVYPNGKHGFFLEYHETVNSDILNFITKHSLYNLDF
jgi:pimeloyl-ACP methyl ester carboxylesterase